MDMYMCACVYIMTVLTPTSWNLHQFKMCSSLQLCCMSHIAMCGSSVQWARQKKTCAPLRHVICGCWAMHKISAK